MLASSFTGYAKPFASVNPSLLPFRASSLRHDYPLASKIVVKSNIPFSPSYPSILFNVNVYLCICCMPFSLLIVLVLFEPCEHILGLKQTLFPCKVAIFMPTLVNFPLNLLIWVMCRRKYIEIGLFVALVIYHLFIQLVLLMDKNQFRCQQLSTIASFRQFMLQKKCRLLNFSSLVGISKVKGI